MFCIASYAIYGIILYVSVFYSVNNMADRMELWFCLYNEVQQWS